MEIVLLHHSPIRWQFVCQKSITSVLEGTGPGAALGAPVAEAPLRAVLAASAAVSRSPAHDEDKLEALSAGATSAVAAAAFPPFNRFLPLS